MLSMPELIPADVPPFPDGDSMLDGNAQLGVDAGDGFMSDQWMLHMQETGLFEGVEGMNEESMHNFLF